MLLLTFIGHWEADGANDRESTTEQNDDGVRRKERGEVNDNRW